MQPLRATTDADQASDCALEVLDSVPPVIWFIRREMRAFRKGLSLAQFRTLALIYRTPSASLSAVAEHIGASLPTASRLVQGLVQQRLLTRQGSADDRRQLSLAITPEGQTVLHTAWSSTRDRLMDQLKDLSPHQKQAVTEAMLVLKGIFGALGLRNQKPEHSSGNGNGRESGSPRPASAGLKRA
jgi:DNA-binding MarR family transcriptional regulator